MVFKEYLDMQRPDYIFLSIKEIYEMNICLLRTSVVKFRNLGKADFEEIGGFYYGWLKLWM